MTSSSKLNSAAVLEDVFFSGLCPTPHNCGGGHLLRQLQLLRFFDLNNMRNSTEGELRPNETNKECNDPESSFIGKCQRELHTYTGDLKR